MLNFQGTTAHLAGGLCNQCQTENLVYIDFDVDINIYLDADKIGVYGSPLLRNPNFSWGVNSDVSGHVTENWKRGITVKRAKILFHVDRIEK